MLVNRIEDGAADVAEIEMDHRSGNAQWQDARTRCDTKRLSCERLGLVMRATGDHARGSGAVTGRLDDLAADHAQVIERARLLDSPRIAQERSAGEIEHGLDLRVLGIPGVGMADDDAVPAG